MRKAIPAECFGKALPSNGGVVGYQSQNPEIVDVLPSWSRSSPTRWYGGRRSRHDVETEDRGGDLARAGGLKRSTQSPETGM